MGYEIIYGKQFIKLDEQNVIPFVKIGSNNCYEPTSNGKMRMERSWNGLKVVNGQHYATLSEMIEAANESLKKHEERNPTEVDEIKNNFGWYACLSLDGTRGCKGSFKKYLSLFTDGFKKALTVEELKAEYISIYVTSGFEAGEKLVGTDLERVSFYPKTSKELKDFLDENTLKYARYGVTLYITCSDSNGFSRINKSRRVKKEPVTITTDKAFVLVDDSGSYVMTYPRGKRSYLTSYLSGANKYYNKAQAERKAVNHNKRYLSKVTVKEIKLTEPKIVVKNW